MKNDDQYQMMCKQFSFITLTRTIFDLHLYRIYKYDIEILEKKL